MLALPALSLESLWLALSCSCFGAFITSLGRNVKTVFVAYSSLNNPYISVHSPGCSAARYLLVLILLSVSTPPAAGVDYDCDLRSSRNKTAAAVLSFGYY